MYIFSRIPQDLGLHLPGDKLSCDKGYVLELENDADLSEIVQQI